MENVPSDGSPTQNSTNKKIKKQSHLVNFGFKSVVKIAGKTCTRGVAEEFSTSISFGCGSCGKMGL